MSIVLPRKGTEGEEQEETDGTEGKKKERDRSKTVQQKLAKNAKEGIRLFS